ncbi:MAG: DUF1553 domain-containing protein [Verrucomicrobia bacterium]|nr:DUF1553 domain-containing protein [Verrucomicrobiota bacterium]
MSALPIASFSKSNQRLAYWAALTGSVAVLHATPANRAALERYFDQHLTKELARCTTCHLPSDKTAPENLDEFPHNPFGHRLRLLGEESAKAGTKTELPSRLRFVAQEDADGDGVGNETELLLGRNPGDPKDSPDANELKHAEERHAGFGKFLASYRWQPFEPVKRPPVPSLDSQAKPTHRSAPLSRGTGSELTSINSPSRVGPGGAFVVRNPIDAFIAAEHQRLNLRPRPEAPKEILLRRVYLDLIGLVPTPDEQRAFASDRSPGAYEKVVDRLLQDPRYGERWGRHWMDIWRYSDWAGWSGGNQIRDSKPHIWRWRDWIVESLNQDKGYDRMILEMLAADELAPEDPEALRATGYLVRNYKMLSREQWLEDTIKHTSQAFLSLTVGCAKCHDHVFDPISQKEYYQIRAVFEPHQVRADRVPGQFDSAKDGLARVFDVATNTPTYFYIRGDERRPDTNRVMSPGILQLLGGALHVERVRLPHFTAFPDKRDFVIQDAVAASDKAVTEAREALTKLRNDAAAKPDKLEQQELTAKIAEAKHAALQSAIQAERLEDENKKETPAWKSAAIEAAETQRKLAILEAKLRLHLARISQREAQTKADQSAKDVEALEKSSTEQTETEQAAADKLAARKKDAEKAAKNLEGAQKKTTEAEHGLAEAEKELQTPSTTTYKPRPMETYPATSTGRRLAFARWLARSENPLTARVAMNHIWLRHFGQGIVATPADFGRNGRAPSHPQLLDWLAAEFMAQHWRMKAMHRLIVTSGAYRMASTPDESNASIDPDNVYLWRMPSRRMEAELVRDNLLCISGDFDSAMGGPEIDHTLGLTSKRRSLYLRIAAEKEVEFLKIFDGPSVTECYLRRPTVVPQQALALANSELTLRHARTLAQRLGHQVGNDDELFIAQAFERILARRPNPEEARLCREFVAAQAKRSPGSRPRDNLVLVLFNHNDFVTIR